MLPSAHFHLGMVCLLCYLQSGLTLKDSIAALTLSFDLLVISFLVLVLLGRSDDTRICSSASD